MQLTDRIAAMIEPGLEALGYEIVRVQLSGDPDGRKGSAQTLQIMCDRQDDKPITVEDCASISRMASAVLDVEDPIGGGEPGRDFTGVTVTGWAPVGGYAIQFNFSDGHRTGLYSFDYLREVGKAIRGFDKES